MIHDTLARFARCSRGNIALTFALTALPLTMLVGMGVDVGNATRVRMALQDATNSAALALARQAPTIADNAVVSTAQTYIRTSYDKTSAFSVTNATIDRNTITATVDASAQAPTYFSKLVGLSSIPVTSHAVAKGMLLEIGMVLDTSGSMAQSAGSGGPKIDALKSAASSFLDAMFGTQSTSQRVSVAIVPFAASVNVGPANANASWMDTAGKSSRAYEDFQDSSKTRWQLFSQLKNTSWAGCVISRPPSEDLDVTDTAPSTGNGDTLFVPWFWPDEPDSGYGYQNSYISDTGGACNKAGLIGQIMQSLHLKQANTCKYKKATPSGGGPNELCNSEPLTPLTNSRSALNSEISSLRAKGDTNIEQGLMWGWRAISPGAPFTEGKPYNAPNNRKIIILMTDGMNNFGGTNNGNMSAYSSYGFAATGLLGTPTSNNNTLDGWMDDRTLKACANAKAQGILIYTIGFGSGAAGSAGLLKACASDPSDYYAPQNSSDLKPVFQKIAQSINSLRIAQ